ncbi:MAG: IPTL-CTERM sorting domain-containing protein [Betaproteobacteria bacterium]|nr:IPTL-CTERM sorting domain-containing protein [Betaproteobacteria bacterium]MDE2210392.1 IPTL-CTERM sorting domain-containing protein [Betaproteobacteria bacterium]MDE2359120.1 IPTL-CTERM sorting domain-containing protein [Betaproteobacteria bacterium]
MPLAQRSGTVPAFSGGSLTFGSTAYPYTFADAVTPKVPGATTTFISVVCNLGVASGFTISNGAPFTLATIPTLGPWALVLLVLLLAASPYWLGADALLRASGSRCVRSTPTANELARPDPAAPTG